jgi:non-ribosomal peptide synthetase-like protein
MTTVLLSQWLFSLISIVFAYCALLAYARFEIVALAVSAVVLTGFSIGYLAFFEWWSLRFRRLRPDRCTILDEPYWRIEHHWKLSDNVLNSLFKGTPFRNSITRLLGSKVGKKVFDDGYATTERSLVEIGDYCTVNEFAIFQAHSLEDGIFKSDVIKIGKGCTVGPNALVHYGVVMAENSVVDSDSFLMKGETPAPGAVWRGNPARQI